MRTLFQVVTTVATLAASFIFTQAASAQVELLQNGSLTAPGAAIAQVPSPWVPGVETCDTNNENLAVGVFPHASGNAIASPNGGTFVGCVSGTGESFVQSVNLVPGTTYTLTFQAANFGYSIPDVLSVTASAPWQVLLNNVVVAQTPSIVFGVAWTNYSFQFTATVTNNQIAFRPRPGGANAYLSIDGISLTANNTPPTANAGSDQTVASGQNVTINASSTDADNDTRAWTWSVVSTTSGNHPPSSIILNEGEPYDLFFTAPTLALGEQDLQITVRFTVNDGRGGVTSDDVVITVLAPTDAIPVIASLNGDSVAFTEGGAPVLLDASGDAAASDLERDALNGGFGDYAGGSVTVARFGGANPDDVLGFDTTGALFTVSGNNLQSGGLTFATFTNVGGQLSISFTSSGTDATTALVSDVLKRISYDNSSSTPPASVSMVVTLSDGISSTAATSTVNVAQIAPVVTSVAVPANDIYAVGDNLDFTVTFSDPITVTGSPRIALNVGGETKYATYVSGSGTGNLVFRYIVAAGDLDLDGVTVGALQANGGTLRDAGADDADLTLNNVGATTRVIVDGVAPTLQSSAPADDAVAVSVDRNSLISLYFTENLYPGTGSARLYKADGTLVQTFDVTNPNFVRFDDNGLHLTLSNDLEYYSAYYIQIDPTAVEDSAGNTFAGIANTTTLNFNTVVASSGTAVNGAIQLSLTLPATMPGNPNIYRLVSSGGTTPAVSGAVTGGVSVRLSVDSGTLAITQTAGLSDPTNSSNWAGGSTITFRGSLANVNAALATLQHKGGAATISGVVSPADAYYLESTGSYYQFVSFGGSFKTWHESLIDARTKSLYGLTGYLAHVTTQEERNFLVAQSGLNTPAWLGGYSASPNNQWVWSTEASSPNSGAAFWSGLVNGVAQNGFFDGFCANEPNTGSSGEPYLQISHQSGCYNDLANIVNPGSYQPQGYFVEFTPNPNSVNTSRAQTQVLPDTTPPTITGPDGSGGTTTVTTASIEIEEGQTAITQFSASDDISATSNIVWSKSGPDAALFTLDQNGRLVFNAVPNFEDPRDQGDGVRNNTYVVIIEATDEAGNTRSQTLTVTVGNLYFPGQPLLTGEDIDGDGAADSAESLVSDRDGDGIADARDYDPQGYFYCQADGRILSGGRVSVTGPGNVTMVHDGSGTGDLIGTYQWYVDAPGTYTMAIDTSGMEFQTIAQPSSGAMVIANFTGNPVVIGSTQIGNTGYLGAFNGTPYDPESPTAYYTTFVIAEGDANVFANNIPFEGCSMNEVVLAATTDAIEPNDDSTSDGLFTVTLSRPAVVDTVITYSVGGTATSGADFAALSGTLVIPAGQTSATISVRVLEDDLDEGPESITVTLTSVSGDSATILPEYPSSSILILDDLVDQIRTPLADILQRDLERTVSAQARDMSRISQGALARLREGNDETACGDLEAFDVDGEAIASGTAVSTSGTFGQDSYNCVTGVRTLMDGNFIFSGSDADDAQGLFNFRMQSETQRGTHALNGRFFGGYTSRSTLNGDTTGTGSVDGIGLNAGLYSARSLEGGLFLDYYAAGTFGSHRYDISFYEPTAPINATGDYSYGALFVGAALSGETVYERFIVRPRMGFDLGYARASDASVTARQLEATDTGRIELQTIEGTRGFAEAVFGFGGPISDAELGEAHTITKLEIAPRVFCERSFGTTDMACGAGAGLRFTNTNPLVGSELTINMDLEGTQDLRRSTVGFSFTRPLRNLAGSAVTQMNTDALGNSTLRQSIDFAF